MSFLPALCCLWTTGNTGSLQVCVTLRFSCHTTTTSSLLNNVFPSAQIRPKTGSNLWEWSFFHLYEAENENIGSAKLHISSQMERLSSLIKRPRPLLFEFNTLFITVREVELKNVHEFGNVPKNILCMHWIALEIL